MDVGTNLYTIIDIVSDTNVCCPIPALNDGIALNGFLSFLKGEEDKGLNRNMYKLVRVGKYNIDGSITSDGNRVIIAHGATAQSSFDDWCTVELTKERMEE